MQQRGQACLRWWWWAHRCRRGLLRDTRPVSACVVSVRGEKVRVRACACVSVHARAAIPCQFELGSIYDVYTHTCTHAQLHTFIVAFYFAFFLFTRLTCFTCIAFVHTAKRQHLRAGKTIAEASTEKYVTNSSYSPRFFCELEDTDGVHRPPFEGVGAPIRVLSVRHGANPPLPYWVDVRTIR